MFGDEGHLFDWLFLYQWNSVDSGWLEYVLYKLKLLYTMLYIYIYYDIICIYIMILYVYIYICMYIRIYDICVNHFGWKMLDEAALSVVSFQLGHWACWGLLEHTHNFASWVQRIVHSNSHIRYTGWNQLIRVIVGREGGGWFRYVSALWSLQTNLQVCIRAYVGAGKLFGHQDDGGLYWIHGYSSRWSW